MTAHLPILPVTLPEGAEALLVLRDWLEQHTGRTDLDRMSEWRLVAYGRAIGASAGLVAAALREAEAPVRQRFEPARLYAELRAKHPRVRVGLLAEAEVAAGVESHLSALMLAASYGLEFDAVTTTMIAEAEGEAFRDEILLVGRSKSSVRRCRRPRSAHRSEIRLPKGWKAEQRRRGWTPPWRTPPEGWSLSGHGWWLQRPLEVP